MIITYERGKADFEKVGKDWKALRWAKHSDSLILFNLWSIIIINTDKNFDEVCKLVKEAYKNRIVKSRVEINLEEDHLEIIRKGVFPNIMIIKNDKNQI